MKFVRGSRLFLPDYIARHEGIESPQDRITAIARRSLHGARFFDLGYPDGGGGSANAPSPAFLENAGFIYTDSPAGSRVRGITEDWLSGRKWVHIGWQGSIGNGAYNFSGAGASDASTAALGYAAGWVTAGTTGSVKGFGIGNTVAPVSFMRDFLPYFCLYMDLDDITSIRFWAGLYDRDPSGSDDPASAHMTAFRFSTSAGDTTWRCCTKDGTTLNAQDSGVTVAADTAYMLEFIYTTTSSVSFYVNGVLVQTISTNLPGATTAMTDQGQGVLTTLTNATRMFRSGFLYASHE